MPGMTFPWCNWNGRVTQGGAALSPSKNDGELQWGTEDRFFQRPEKVLLTSTYEYVEAPSKLTPAQGVLDQNPLGLLFASRAVWQIWGTPTLQELFNGI